MGLHTGAVKHRDNDYFGPPLNTAARLMSIGHGGQILVLAATRELIRDQLPVCAELVDMGEHLLKYQVVPDAPSHPAFALTGSYLPHDHLESSVAGVFSHGFAAGRRVLAVLHLGAKRP